MRTNGSRHRRAHAKSTILGKLGVTRIVLRGTKWYAQRRVGERGTRDRFDFDDTGRRFINFEKGDCWHDIAGGYSKADAARIANVDLN